MRYCCWGRGSRQLVAAQRQARTALVGLLPVGLKCLFSIAWLGRTQDAPEAAATITLRASDVAWLSDIWSRQWNRQPTTDEMRGLVSDYLKEELLSREARAMKLDENDHLIGVATCREGDDVLLATRSGRCIRFQLTDDIVRFGANFRL